MGHQSNGGTYIPLLIKSKESLESKPILYIIPYLDPKKAS
jgi:hypothetical protein